MKNDNKKTNKIILIVCIIAIISILGIWGISAYLTDTDTATNQFVVGQVKIELKEPSWESATDLDGNGIPDYAENVVPNDTIQKDPQIKNIGNNSAYVYLKVTVPVKNVVVANNDGTLLNEGNPTNTQLFTYNINNDWKEIVSARKENLNSSNEVESYTYVYYYNKALGGNETTTALFNTVTFANLVEGQAELGSYQIDLNAYAIQSENLPNGTTIEGAYAIYMNQNG